MKIFFFFFLISKKVFENEKKIIHSRALFIFLQYIKIKYYCIIINTIYIKISYCKKKVLKNGSEKNDILPILQIYI
jgi:hypothetical protein